MFTAPPGDDRVLLHPQLHDVVLRYLSNDIEAILGMRYLCRETLTLTDNFVFGETVEFILNPQYPVHMQWMTSVFHTFWTLKFHERMGREWDLRVVGPLHAEVNPHGQVLQASQWSGLGSALERGRTLTLRGVDYTDHACLCKALFIDSTIATGWSRLGATLDQDEEVTLTVRNALEGTSETLPVDRLECFKRAVHYDDNYSQPWYNMVFDLSRKRQPLVLLDGTSVAAHQARLKGFVRERGILLKWNAWIAQCPHPTPADPKRATTPQLIPFLLYCMESPSAIAEAAVKALAEMKWHDPDDPVLHRYIERLRGMAMFIRQPTAMAMAAYGFYMLAYGTDPVATFTFSLIKDDFPAMIRNGEAQARGLLYICTAIFNFYVSDDDASMCERLLANGTIAAMANIFSSQRLLVKRAPDDDASIVHPVTGRVVGRLTTFFERLFTREPEEMQKRVCVQANLQLHLRTFFIRHEKVIAGGEVGEVQHLYQVLDVVRSHCLDAFAADDEFCAVIARLHKTWPEELRPHAMVSTARALRIES